MPEWMPIESAPKKGSVLLWAPADRHAVGIWFFGGWAFTEDDFGDPLTFEPTHWMPLPPSPPE